MIQRLLFGGTMACLLTLFAFFGPQSAARGQSPATQSAQPGSAKYGFFIYGDFDGERAGQIDPARPEKLAQIIRQSAGRVMDRINISTDFVILGQEPLVRELTAAEKLDANLVAMHAVALQKLAAYQDIRQQARDFDVPVLTQAQFLVLCGAAERVNQ